MKWLLTADGDLVNAAQIDTITSHRENPAMVIALAPGMKIPLAVCNDQAHAKRCIARFGIYLCDPEDDMIRCLEIAEATANV